MLTNLKELNTEFFVEVFDPAFVRIGGEAEVTVINTLPVPVVPSPAVPVIV